MADLRPMNFGEVLDGALTIFRRHFGLFLKLSVVLLAVPAAVGVFFALRFMSEITVRPVQTLLLLIPLGILYYIATLVLTAGTVRIIADSYLGRPPTFGDAISLGLSKIWPLFVVGLGKGILLALIGMGVALAATIVTAVLKGVGLIAVPVMILVICGGLWFLIFVACGYGVTTQVVVLEELASSFDAFPRSWELTRSLKLKVFGLAVVAFLLFNFVPSQVLQIISGAVMDSSAPIGIGLLTLSFAVQIVLAPAMACVFTLMYYDMRVRREAFDLQVLSQQLGIA